MEYVSQFCSRDNVINKCKKEHGPFLQDKSSTQTTVWTSNRQHVKAIKPSATLFTYLHDSNKFVSSVYIEVDNIFNNTNGRCNNVTNSSRVFRLSSKHGNNERYSNACSLVTSSLFGNDQCHTIVNTNSDRAFYDFTNVSTGKHQKLVMATATGPARSMSSSLSQNTNVTDFPTISLGSFHLTNRRSRTMLSEGSISMQSPASTSLHSFTDDIDTSSVLVRKDGSRLQLKNDSNNKISKSAENKLEYTSPNKDTRPLHGHFPSSLKSGPIPSIDHYNNIGPGSSHSTGPLKASAEIIEENKRQTAAISRNENDTGIERRQKTSFKIPTPGIVCKPAISDIDNLHETNREISTTDIMRNPDVCVGMDADMTSVSKPKTGHKFTHADLYRPIESTYNRTKIMREANIDNSDYISTSSLAGMETRQSSLSSLTEIKAGSNIIGRHKNEKKNNRWRMLSIDGSTVDEQDLQNGGVEKQSLFDSVATEVGGLETQSINQSVPAKKTKSKFLTELYSGAEKIKKFIHKGKIKKENNKLSSLLKKSPSMSENEVLSETQEEFQSHQRGFQNVDRQETIENYEMRTSLQTELSQKRSLSKINQVHGNSLSRNVSNFKIETKSNNLELYEQTNAGLSSDREKQVEDYEDCDNEVFFSPTSPHHTTRSNNDYLYHSSFDMPIPKRRFKVSNDANIKDFNCSKTLFSRKTNVLPRRRLSLPNNSLEVNAAITRNSMKLQTHTTGSFQNTTNNNNSHRYEERNYLKDDATQGRLTSKESNLKSSSTRINISPPSVKHTSRSVLALPQSADTISSHRSMIGEDRNSYSYIDTSQSEIELRELLNVSTDLSERHKIRSRLHELETKRDMGSHDGVLPKPQVYKESPERSASSCVSTSSGGASSCSDDTEAASIADNVYEKITSLTELQALLSTTPDAGERYKIRIAIRKLRHRPELERLKPPEPRTIQRNGRPPLQRSYTVGCGLTESHATASSSDIVPLQHQQNSNLHTSTQSSEICNERHSYLALKPGNVTSYKVSNVPDKYTLKNVSDAHKQNKIKFSGDNDSQVSLDFYSRNKLRIPTVVNNTDNDVLCSNNIDDVSSILEQVKAKLKARSDIYTTESESSVFHNSPYDCVSQSSANNAVQSKSKNEFHIAPNETSRKTLHHDEDSMSIQSSDKISDRRPSIKYRDELSEILKSANIPSSSIEPWKKSSTFEPRLSFAHSSQNLSDNRLGSEINHSAISVSLDCDDTDQNENNAPTNFSKTDLKENRPQITPRKTIKTVARVLDENSTCEERTINRNIDKQLHSSNDKKIFVVAKEKSVVPKTSPRTQRAHQSSSAACSDIQTNVVQEKINEPEQLTDFQKLDRGQKPSKSRSFVSSLAAKFSKFGKENEQVFCSPLRRSQSLNTKVLIPLNMNTTRVLAGKTVMESTQQHKYQNNGSAVNSNDVAEQITNITSDSSTSSESGQTHTNYKHKNVLETNTLQEINVSYKRNKPTDEFTFFDSKQNQSKDEMKSITEIVEPRPKPTMRRYIPLYRSLTESQIIRPIKYSSLVELSKTGTEEGMKSETGHSIRSCEIFSINGNTTSSDNRNISGTGLNIQGHNNTPELHSHFSDYDQEIALKTATSEDFINEALHFGNRNDHPNYLQEISVSSNHQKLQSTTNSKQQNCTMERAFSLLLEELDKISSSEGNLSDLDSVDGDDFVFLSSSYSKVADLSPFKQETNFTSIDSKINGKETCSEVHKSITVESVNSGEYNTFDTHVDKSSGDFTAKPVTQPLVHNITVTQPLVHNITVTQPLVHNSALTDESKVRVTDDLIEQEKKPVAKPRRLLPTLPLTKTSPSSTITRISDSVTISKDHRSPSGTADGSKVKDEVTEAPTKFTNMDVDMIDELDCNKNNNTPTYTSEMKLPIKLFEPMTNMSNIPGTRTFTFNTKDDGTLTLQATAEDSNENHIVTVRTKAQRTPSNANEEMRDTIVEKKKMLPEGTVLVEKDVVNTKTRLTSRGSNYYTRSTYTTRTRRDRGGSETVEHNVSVETDNKSVSQGHSWGEKTIATILLEDVNNSNISPNSISFPSGPDGIPQVPFDNETHQINDHDMCQNKDSETKDNNNGLVTETYTHNIKDLSSFNVKKDTCKLQKLPVFEKGLTDVTAKEGHSLIVSCCVSNATSIDWFKGGILLKSSSDLKQTFNGREARLEIDELSVDDAGEYACVAKSPSGEVKTVCILNVEAADDQETHVVPMFLTKIPNMAVTEGETLTLECDVIGSPDPTIKWLKDGIELRSYLEFSSSYDGRVANLQVYAVCAEDAGCYQCVAENIAGKASNNAVIDVKEKRISPQFLSPLQDQKIMSGSNIILQCHVIGSPQPIITWKKDGSILPPSHVCVQSFNNGLSKLEILGATAQDGGRYECRARNDVSEASNQCHVIVADPRAMEATAPKKDQLTTTIPKLSKQRVFKKLSEPRPADIITAVIQRAALHGVQRAQSFSPGSSVLNKHKTHHVTGETFDSTSSHYSGLNYSDQAETVEITRNSPRNIPTPSSNSVYSDSITSSTSIPHQPLARPTYYIPRNTSIDINEPQPNPPARISNLSRSSSVNIGRSWFQPPKSELHPFGGSTNVLSSPTKELINAREIITKSLSHEVLSDNRPSHSIPGYRPVSPNIHASQQEKHKIGISPLTKIYNQVENEQLHNIANSSQQTDTNDKEYVSSLTLSSSTSLSSQSSEYLHSSKTNSKDLPTASILSSTQSSKLNQKFSIETSTENEQQSSQTKIQAPSVSSLRLHFLKSDESDATNQQDRLLGNSATAGVRRWHSLPPRDIKPTVIQRKPVLNTKFPIMPNYQDITNEEELHKMMNATEDFEERKKIRARLREIRDKQREEQEAKRKQREAEAEDLVKKKFERAEEEKKKKLEAYKQQAPTHEREGKYHEVTQSHIQEKFKASEDEKAKKLAAYSNIAAAKAEEATKTTINTKTEKTSDGGTRTITQKTTETKGFGGTSYGKPAEVTARELTAKLMRSSGPGVIGHVTVKTEAWNSTDGLVEKSEKSHSWGGAKPQGAKSAMAAFKQMDNVANPNAAAKPKAMVRSPSAIKDILLNWAKAMTQGYSGVEVTNFSSSWNNGLAFCALIHHFFPNAFDFSKLDPKQRRYNFTLAFETAEKEADIAPLLDVEDMVHMKNPDWKCVFTYVQSIYRHLKDHENNKASTIEQ